MYNRLVKQPPPRPITRHPAYRRAIQELDEALEQNSEHPNTENIRLIRRAYFADVDDLGESGAIQLPKRKS
jgi:hypothetical protein